MKSTTNQLYAIVVLLFIFCICEQVQIDTLKRKHDTAMFNLAIFEDETIETEANYDDVFNDLYDRLHLHEEEIQRIGSQYEYHVNLEPWGYKVYDDRGRLIGAAPVEASALDEIFVRDNE